MSNVSDQVQADVNNEMLQMFERTLDLTPGEAISAKTRKHLERVLPKDLFDKINGTTRLLWTNTADQATITQIYQTLAETRTALGSFIDVKNPGNETVYGQRLSALIRDPKSKEGKSLLFFLRHLEATGRVPTDAIQRILHAPDTAERVMLRELPNFKKLLRKITENSEFHDLGNAGVIVPGVAAVPAIPPAPAIPAIPPRLGPDARGRPAAGKLGRLQNQILAKQLQIHRLENPPPTPATPPPPMPPPAPAHAPFSVNVNVSGNTPPPPAPPAPIDNSPRLDKLQDDITKLETQMLEIEGKKRQLRTQITPLNRSLQTLTGAATPPWSPNDIDDFTIDVETTLDAAAGAETVYYDAHPFHLDEAIADDSPLMRASKSLGTKPPSGTLPSGANTLKELVQEFGAQNVRYSDEADLQKFTTDFYDRLVGTTLNAAEGNVKEREEKEEKKKEGNDGGGEKKKGGSWLKTLVSNPVVGAWNYMTTRDDKNILGIRVHKEK